MKTVGIAFAFIAGIVGIALLGDIAYAAGANDAAGTPGGIGWTGVLGVIGGVLGIVSIILHMVAPRTKTTLDDALVEKIDQVLAFLPTAPKTARVDQTVVLREKP